MGKKIKSDLGRDPVTGRKLKDKTGRPPEKQGGRPVTSTSPKQVRARARRRGYLLDEEVNLVTKPLDKWDLEELARGKCKRPDGTFAPGPAPTWITPQMLEEAKKRFQDEVKSRMSQLVPDALDMLAKLMGSNERDARGRPIVPPNTKVEIAKFLMEHAVGKPEQRIKTDLSVQLQGLLAHVMVNPEPEDTSDTDPSRIPGLPGYVRASVSAPIIEADVIDDEDRVSKIDG